MAPSKRPREASDAERFPSGQPGPSQRPQNGAKRHKIAGKQQAILRRDSESVTPPPQARASDDEDDEEVGEDSGEDEEALEASTQRAREAIEAKNSQFTTNAPADFGIVLSIELENFMCHDHLIVDFGPLINFVIGHNGSGKSAILTALTLCLGGKAASTNRGSSLKAFIKEGKSHSRITIKLKNGGDGYKPEEYGDIIIVERTFTRDGSSGYKLKAGGHKGKIVSTKREELDEICDYMGLQVDNPMNILTQDAARQFINNSSDKEKYKFFVKGVQLEQLDQDYKLLIDAIQSTEFVLETKKGMLAGLKNKLEEAKKKVLLCKGQNEIRNKITTVNNQIAWVQVEAEEKKLEEAKIELAAIEDTISRVQNKIRNSDEKFERASAAVERATEALSSTKEDSRPLVDNQRQLKENCDRNKKDLAEIQIDLRQAKATVQATERRVQSTANQIEVEKQRIASIDSTAKLIARKEELAQLRERAAEKIQSLDAEKQAAQGASSEARLKLNEATRLVESKQREIEATRAKIQDLKASQTGYMSVFGEKMPHLLKAIDEAGRRGEWKERPIGPLGQHIKLLRDDWSSILESVLGNQLRGFIVTNHDDKGVLMNLMERVRFDCPIYVCKSNPINLQRPHSQYTTILDILEIANPLVTKQLVITSAIEQSLLFDEQEEANRAWSTVTENNKHSINIKVCYAKNQGKRGWGLKIGGGKIGANNVKPVKPGNGAPKMKTDLDSQLRQVQSEMNQLMAELEQLKSDRMQRSQALNAIDARISGYTGKRMQLVIDMQRIDLQLEKVRMDISDNAAENRLIGLENALRELQEELVSEQNMYQDLVNRRNELNDTHNKSKEQLQHAEQELEEVQTMVSKREMELHQAQQNRQQALVDKNHWYTKLEQEQEALNLQKNKVDSQAETVRDFNLRAGELCPRLVLERGTTKEKLMKYRDRLSVELQESEKQMGGTRAEIVAAYEAANRNYQRSNKYIEKGKVLLNVMKKSYRDRIYRWKKFRHYISARARAQFMWHMNTRSYRGRLRIDHEAKTLMPEVQTNQRDTGAGRGPKTLSGGEKSFSTVCLLLALWEAMGSPIRCLDEFDVFMDPVNRTVSVNLMISGARRSIGKQFILITPQDMSAIEKAHDVKVTRLDDPQRNGQRSITSMLQQQ